MTLLLFGIKAKVEKGGESSVEKHENIEKSRNVIEKSSPVSNHVSWADVVRSSSATGSKVIKQ